MDHRSLRFALAGIVAVPAMAFTFGGWAVITVDDLPEHLVAGKPVQLPFSVRQHGMTPMEGLEPTVTLKSGWTTVTASTVAGASKGHYVATVTPPKAGEWTIRIQSGFGPSETTLLPLDAIAAGAAAPAALPAPIRGQQLFVAKGCNTCHMRNDAPAGLKVGPDLTGRRYPVDYVSKFLADPENHPLGKAGYNGNRMPKLDLKEREIASLVSFLNSEGQVSKR